MRFTLFKPLHGWREFAGEVGIVVLGVLLALGAQQLVEGARDRREARDARRAIKDEVEQNLIAIRLRAGAEPCIQRRLGEVHDLVNQWGTTGTFTTPLWVAQAPAIETGLPRYEAAIDAGTITLLSPEEQYQLGTMATALRNFQRVEDQERHIWATLRMLQDGAAALSPSDRTEIRGALQQAATLDYTARLLIRQALPRAAQFGFRPDQRRFAEYARTIWKSGRFTPAICAAIDTPPAKANEMTGQQTPLPF